MAGGAMKGKIEGTEPLSEAAFLILLSVADEPLHGYAIMKRVEQLSGGRVRLSTGTLYGAIKRFLDAGWVRRVEEGSPLGADYKPPRARKSYRLTAPGARVLAEETSRLEQLARAASKALARAPGRLLPARDAT